MKKLGVILVIFLFAAGMTIAQERGGGARPSKTEQGRPGGGSRLGSAADLQGFLEINRASS